MNNAGVGSGDYVEQVTYLLFLKLDAEREEEDGLPSALPEDCRWARLAALTAANLRNTTPHAGNPGRAARLVGTIYTRAKSTIEEPAHLHRWCA